LPGCFSSAGLSPATAPASSVAFALNVHDDIHAAAFEELHSAFADVFWICDAGCNDVDDAQDLFLDWWMGMGVVVVAMIVSM